jgi:hypothetical protein
MAHFVLAALEANGRGPGVCSIDPVLHNSEQVAESRHRFRLDLDADLPAAVRFVGQARAEAADEFAHEVCGTGGVRDFNTDYLAPRRHIQRVPRQRGEKRNDLCAASRMEDPFRLRRPGPGDHSIVSQERNILLVLLDGLGSATLRQAVRRRLDEAAHVHVVAPTRVGTLDWLATDEDAARATAEVQALEAEWALADDADVDAEAGDVDPIVAVEDALRRFDADEILLVGGASENGGIEDALERFDRPVSRVDDYTPLRERSSLREFGRAIRSGRSKATPFVFFASVNLALLVLAATISLIVLLILWLR